jgi:plasmid stability protein
MHTDQPHTTTLTIRNVASATKERLRVRAASHGRSMEAELRAILNTALESGPDREVNLAEAIRRRFAPVGGVDLADHPRELVADPIDFMS